jgi:hypothetical protein
MLQPLPNQRFSRRQPTLLQPPLRRHQHHCHHHHHQQQHRLWAIASGAADEFT